MNKLKIRICVDSIGYGKMFHKPHAFNERNLEIIKYLQTIKIVYYK